jgi:hypothetical protein
VEDLIAWLRATIEGDKALAEAVKDPAEISMGAEFVDNCGSDEAAEHIRRHDLQDTIARCEAELVLLDNLLPELEQADRLIEGEWGSSDDLAKKLIVTMVASRRHRHGFKPSWLD